MVRRPAMNVGLFLLGQVLLIAGAGYLLSHITIRVESLLWLILTSVTWFGFLIVYTLIIGVDRTVELLKDIGKKSVPTSDTPT
jgi:hypothetical protein